MKYTPLHGHSDFSILDACSNVKSICNRAAEIGLEHIALTDHGTMAGIFEFYKESNAVGINPILGVEAYIVEDRLQLGPTDEQKEGLDKTERDALNKKHRKYNHVGLIAQNNTGLKNLFNVVSDAARNGTYYRPRTDWDFLAEHSKGVIALSGCLQGKANRLILDGDLDGALDHLKQLKDIFGKRVVAELQVNEAPEQRICNEKIYMLAKKVGMPLVVTNDYHYVSPESVEAHRMCKFIDYIKGRGKRDLEFCGFEGYKTTGHFVASYDELKMLWVANHGNMTKGIFNKACENTMKIAESCNVSIDNSHKLVKFPLQEGMSQEQYLKKIVTHGWNKRKHRFVEGKKEEYTKRIQKEINLIKKMGYLDYFFMVQDFILWAKGQGIPIGPGRGSAAGSLLSWLLEITQIDPIRYGLSFERFLNPHRKKMPDIDVDVCKRRRGEVLQYMKDRWGEENVAAVATYHRFTSNSLFREVSRALGCEYNTYNDIAKKIDHTDTWENNLGKNKELKAYVEENQDINLYMDELDGNIKNFGTHAAAIIITNGNISDYLPLRRTKDTAGNINIITEIEKDLLEAFGYLKKDILGLKTLTIIADAATAAGMTYEDLEDIPVDDPEVYKMFREGDTVGVFQFHGSGMTDLAVAIEVENMEDLSACNTMYRPAVLKAGIDKSFIRRRRGDEEVTFLHPKLKDVLEPTEGLIIYQEQIIHIMMKLGLDEGEADLMRNDMEKVYKGAKPQSVLDEWIDKAKKRGFGEFDEDEAEDIIGQVMAQIGYLFNKAHSVSYSLIGYICQWLKVYHPYEFLTACLNNESKLEKIEEYLAYFKNTYLIEIEIGDLNNFSVDFCVEGEDIIKVGLENTKGLSKKVLDMVNENRPYESVMDFFDSDIDWRVLNKRKLQTMSELGLFDGMSIYKDGPVIAHANQMKGFYNGLRTYGSGETNHYVTQKQDYDVWDEVYNDILLYDSPSFADLAQKEVEYFGFHIIYDPLSYIRNNFDFKKIGMVMPGTLAVGGVVNGIKLHIDKKGNEMAFVSLKTLEDFKDIVIFASQWGHYSKKLQIGSCGIFFLSTSDRRSYIVRRYDKVELPHGYDGE